MSLDEHKVWLPILYLNSDTSIIPDGFKHLFDGYYNHFEIELNKETDPLNIRIFKAAIGCKSIAEIVDKILQNGDISIPFASNKQEYLSQKVSYAILTRSPELKNQVQEVAAARPDFNLFVRPPRPYPGPIFQHPSPAIIPSTSYDVVNIFIVGAPGVGKKTLQYLLEKQIELVHCFLSQAFQGITGVITLDSGAVYDPNAPVPLVLFHLADEAIESVDRTNNCNIFVYVYSVCQADSFEFIFSKVLTGNHENSDVVVVGNKLDMTYWSQYKPGEVENRLLDGYNGTVSYVDLSCLSLLNFDILSEFIMSKVFSINYNALNFALSLCKIDAEAATVLNMEEVNKNIRSFGGLQYNIPFDEYESPEDDYEEDEDSYIEDGGISDIEEGGISDSEEGEVSDIVDGGIYMSNIVESGVIEDEVERRVEYRSRSVIDKSKKKDEKPRYKTLGVSLPLPPPLPLLPPGAGGVLPPPRPSGVGGVLPPPLPPGADLVFGAVAPTATKTISNPVELLGKEKKVKKAAVLSKKSVPRSVEALPSQQNVLESVSFSALKPLPSSLQASVASTSISSIPMAPVRSSSIIPGAELPLRRRQLVVEREEADDVDSRFEALADILAAEEEYIPASKEKLYTDEPDIEDGLDITSKIQQKLAIEPLEIEPLEVEILEEEEPMKKIKKPSKKISSSMYSCFLDLLQHSKKCLLQVYQVLTGGDNKLFDNVMADTENAFQTLAKLLVFLMGIQENLVNIAAYALSYCVTFISSISLILPSFFTLLIVRVNKIEKESKDFGIRQEKVRDEKVEESFVRWVRIILRSLPMTFYITIVPWLLVYYSFPHSSKNRVVGGLVGFVCGVIVLQIFGTVRSYYSWLEKKDEVGIKTVPAMYNETDVTYLGIFTKKDPEGNAVKKQVPQAYPYIPNKFAFTSLNNLMTIASLGLEFFQMATFPLQNNPYDNSSVSDDASSSASTDASTDSSTDWWGAKIYDVVYINWVVANLQYISMWFTIALVFALLLVFTHQFVYELYKYGLLLRDRKDKDIAKDQFFFSFTGSVVYGHGNPNNISDTKKLLIAGLSDGLFLVISMRLLDIISCDYIDPASPTLYTDPSIVCWSSDKHRPLAALALNCYAFYIPLSIMIAPMLLEAGGTGGGVGYSKIYLMFVNVVKSIMLLVGALGPKTVQTVVISAILTSFCLGAVTIGWFQATDPSKFNNLSVDLEPCNIAFINLFKAASYTASVVSAIIIIVAHEMGPKKFTQEKLLPTLVIFWIGILFFYWFLHYKWRENHGKRYNSIEKMAMYPFEWRDYLQHRYRNRLNILNQLKGLNRDKNVISKSDKMPSLELPLDDSVVATGAEVVLDIRIYLKNKLDNKNRGFGRKLIEMQGIGQQ